MSPTATAALRYQMSDTSEAKRGPRRLLEDYWTDPEARESRALRVCQQPRGQTAARPSQSRRFWHFPDWDCGTCMSAWSDCAFC